MRIGIFGGSFNPIHLGHLLVAEDVTEQLKLDKMVFIPTFLPPHKKELLSYQHRCKMLKLAIHSNPLFELSNIEAERQSKSFTIDTLRELKKQFSQDQLFLIMGTDQFASLAHWKEPEKLFQLAKVVVIQRPNFPLRRFRSQKPIFLKVIQVDIASAEIRRRLRLNRSVRYLLPEKVWRYIIKNHLYQNNKTSAFSGQRRKQC